MRAVLALLPVLAVAQAVSLGSLGDVCSLIYDSPLIHTDIGVLLQSPKPVVLADVLKDALKLCDSKTYTFEKSVSCKGWDANILPLSIPGCSMSVNVSKCKASISAAVDPAKNTVTKFSVDGEFDVDLSSCKLDIAGGSVNLPSGAGKAAFSGSIPAGSAITDVLSGAVTPVITRSLSANGQADVVHPLFNDGKALKLAFDLEHKDRGLGAFRPRVNVEFPKTFTMPKFDFKNLTLADLRVLQSVFDPSNAIAGELLSRTPIGGAVQRLLNGETLTAVVADALPKNIVTALEASAPKMLADYNALGWRVQRNWNHRIAAAKEWKALGAHSLNGALDRVHEQLTALVGNAVGDAARSRTGELLQALLGPDVIDKGSFDCTLDGSVDLALAVPIARAFLGAGNKVDFLKGLTHEEVMKQIAVFGQGHVSVACEAVLGKSNFVVTAGVDFSTGEPWDLYALSTSSRSLVQMMARRAVRPYGAFALNVDVGPVSAVISDLSIFDEKAPTVHVNVDLAPAKAVVDSIFTQLEGEANALTRKLPAGLAALVSVDTLTRVLGVSPKQAKILIAVYEAIQKDKGFSLKSATAIAKAAGMPAEYEPYVQLVLDVLTDGASRAALLGGDGIGQTRDRAWGRGTELLKEFTGGVLSTVERTTAAANASKGAIRPGSRKAVTTSSGELVEVLISRYIPQIPPFARSMVAKVITGGEKPTLVGFIRFIESACTNSPPEFADKLAMLCLGIHTTSRGLSETHSLERHGIRVNASFEISPTKVDLEGIGILVQVRAHLSGEVEYRANGTREVAKDLCKDCAVPTLALKPADGSPLQSVQQLAMLAFGALGGGLEQKYKVAVRGAQNLQGKSIALAAFSDASFAVDSVLDLELDVESSAVIQIAFSLGGSAPVAVKLASFEPFVHAIGTASLAIHADVGVNAGAAASVGGASAGGAAATFASAVDVYANAAVDVTLDKIDVTGAISAHVTINADVASASPLFAVSSVAHVEDKNIADGIQFGAPRFEVKFTKTDVEKLVDMLIAKVERLLGDVNVDEVRELKEGEEEAKPSPLFETVKKVLNQLGVDLLRPGQSRGLAEILRDARDAIKEAPEKIADAHLQRMVDLMVDKLRSSFKASGALSVLVDAKVDLDNFAAVVGAGGKGREAEAAQLAIPANWDVTKGTLRLSTQIDTCWSEQIPFSHVTFLKDAFDKMNNLPFISAQLSTAEQAYVPGMAIHTCIKATLIAGYDAGKPYAGVSNLHAYAKPNAQMPSFAINLPMIAGAAVRGGHISGDVSIAFNNTDATGEIPKASTDGALAGWVMNGRIEAALPVYASLLGQDIIAGDAVSVTIANLFKDPRPVVTLPDVDRFLAAIKLTPANALLLLKSILSAPQDLLGPGGAADSPIPLIAASIGDVFNLQDKLDAVIPYLERPMSVAEDYFDTFAPAICEGAISTKDYQLKLRAVWNRDPTQLVPVKRSIEDALQTIPGAKKLVGKLVGEGAPFVKLPNEVEVAIPLKGFSKTTVLTSIIPVLAKLGLTADIIEDVPCDGAVGTKAGCQCWQLRFRPDLTFATALWDLELAAELVEVDATSPTGTVAVTIDGRPVSALGAFPALDTIPSFDSWDQAISLIANLALGDCTNPLACVAQAIDTKEGGRFSRGPVSCDWKVEFGQPGLPEDVKEFFPLGMVVAAKCDFATEIVKGAATKINIDLKDRALDITASGAAQLVASANASIKASAVFPSLPMNDELRLITHLGDHRLTRDTATVVAGQQWVYLCAEWDTRHVAASGKHSVVHHDQCHNVSLPVGKLYPGSLEKLPSLLPEPLASLVYIDVLAVDAKSTLHDELMIVLKQRIVNASSSAALRDHVGKDFKAPLRGLVSPVRFEIRESAVKGILGLPAAGQPLPPPEIVEFGAYRLVIEDTDIYAAVTADIMGGAADINFNKVFSASTDGDAFNAYGHAMVHLKQNVPLTPTEIAASFVRTDLLRRHWNFEFGASINGRAGPLVLSALDMDIAATPAIGIRTGYKVDPKGRKVQYYAPFDVNVGEKTALRRADTQQAHGRNDSSTAFPVDAKAVAEVVMVEVWKMVEEGKISIPNDALLRPAEAVKSVISQLIGFDVTILGGKEFTDFVDLVKMRPSDMSLCDAVGSFTKLATVASQLPLADRKLPLIDLSIADVWDRIDPFVNAVDDICEHNASIAHLGMIESLLDQHLSKLTNDSSVSITKNGTRIIFDFGLTTPTLGVKTASRWDLGRLLGNGKNTSDNDFLAKLNPGIGVEGELTVSARMMVKTLIAIDLLDWSISLLSQSGVATSLYLKAYADVAMTIGEPLALRGNIGVRSGNGADAASQIGLFIAKDWKIVKGSREVPPMQLGGHGSAGLRGAVTYAGQQCEISFTMSDLPAVIRGDSNALVVVNEFAPGPGQKKCDLIELARGAVATFALQAMLKKSRQLTDLMFVPIFKMRDKLMTRSPGSVPLVGPRAHQAVIDFFTELKATSDTFHDNLAKAVAADPLIDGKPTEKAMEILQGALCDALESHKMAIKGVCPRSTSLLGASYIYPVVIDRKWTIAVPDLEFHLGGKEATGEIQMTGCKTSLEANVKLAFTIIVDPKDGIRLALTTKTVPEWFEASAIATIPDACTLNGRLGVLGTVLTTTDHLCPRFEEGFYKYIHDPKVAIDTLKRANRLAMTVEANSSAYIPYMNYDADSAPALMDVFNPDHVRAVALEETSSFNRAHVRAAQVQQASLSSTLPLYAPLASGIKLEPPAPVKRTVYPTTSLANGIDIRFKVLNPPDSPWLDHTKGVRASDVGDTRGFSLYVGVKAVIRARTLAGLVGMAQAGLENDIASGKEGEWKGGLPRFSVLVNFGWAFAVDTGRKANLIPPALAVCESNVCLGTLTNDVLRAPLIKMQKAIEPLEPLLGPNGLRREINFPSKMTVLDLLLRVQTSSCRGDTCAWEGVNEWFNLATDIYDMAKELNKLADAPMDAKCGLPIAFKGDTCVNCDGVPVVTARGERLQQRFAMVMSDTEELSLDKSLDSYATTTAEKNVMKTIQKHIYAGKRRISHPNSKTAGIKLAMLDDPMGLLMSLLIPFGGDHAASKKIVELVFPEFLISYRVSWLVPLNFPLSCLAPRVNLAGSLRIDIGSISLTHLGFLKAWKHVRSESNSAGIVKKSNLILSNVLGGVGLSTKVSPTEDRALLAFGLDVSAVKSLDFVTVMNDCLGGVMNIPKWVLNIAEKARSFLPVDVDFQADFKISLTMRGSFFLPDPNNDGISTLSEMYWMVKFNGVRFMTLKMQLYFAASGVFKLQVKALFKSWDVVSAKFGEEYSLWSVAVSPSCWPPQVAYQDQVNMMDMGSKCYSMPPAGRQAVPKPNEVSLDSFGSNDDSALLEINTKPWWEEVLAPTVSATGQAIGGAITIPKDRPSDAARADTLNQASFTAPPKGATTTTTPAKTAPRKRTAATAGGDEAPDTVLIGDHPVDLVVNNVLGTVAAPMHKFNSVRWPTATLPGTAGTINENGASGFGSGGFDIKPRGCELLNMAAAKAGHVTDVNGIPCDTLVNTERLVVAGTADKFHGTLLAAPPRIEEGVHPVGKESVKRLNFVESGLPFRNKLGLSILSETVEVARVGIDMVEEVALVASTTGPTKFIINDKDDSYTLRIAGAGQDGHVYLGPHVHGPVNVIGGSGYNILIHDLREGPKERHPVFQAREAAERAERAEDEAVNEGARTRRAATAAIGDGLDFALGALFGNFSGVDSSALADGAASASASSYITALLAASADRLQQHARSTLSKTAITAATRAAAARGRTAATAEAMVADVASTNARMRSAVTAGNNAMKPLEYFTSAAADDGAVSYLEAFVHARFNADPSARATAETLLDSFPRATRARTLLTDAVPATRGRRGATLDAATPGNDVIIGLDFVSVSGGGRSSLRSVDQVLAQTFYLNPQNDATNNVEVLSTLPNSIFSIKGSDGKDNEHVMGCGTASTLYMDLGGNDDTLIVGGGSMAGGALSCYIIADMGDGHDKVTIDASLETRELHVVSPTENTIILRSFEPSGVKNELTVRFLNVEEIVLKVGSGRLVMDIEYVPVHDGVFKITAAALKGDVLAAPDAPHKVHVRRLEAGQVIDVDVSETRRAVAVSLGDNSDKTTFDDVAGFVRVVGDSTLPHGTSVRLAGAAGTRVAERAVIAAANGVTCVRPITAADATKIATATAAGAAASPAALVKANCASAEEAASIATAATAATTALAAAFGAEAACAGVTADGVLETNKGLHGLMVVGHVAAVEVVGGDADNVVGVFTGSDASETYVSIEARNGNDVIVAACGKASRCRVVGGSGANTIAVIAPEGASVSVDATAVGTAKGALGVIVGDGPVVAMDAVAPAGGAHAGIGASTTVGGAVLELSASIAATAGMDVSVCGRVARSVDVRAGATGAQSVFVRLAHVAAGAATDAIVTVDGGSGADVMDIVVSGFSVNARAGAGADNVTIRGARAARSTAVLAATVDLGEGANVLGMIFDGATVKVSAGDDADVIDLTVTGAATTVATAGGADAVTVSAVGGSVYVNSGEGDDQVVVASHGGAHVAVESAGGHDIVLAGPVTGILRVDTGSGDDIIGIAAACTTCNLTTSTSHINAGVGNNAVVLARVGETADAALLAVNISLPAPLLERARRVRLAAGDASAAPASFERVEVLADGVTTVLVAADGTVAFRGAIMSSPGSYVFTPAADNINVRVPAVGCPATLEQRPTADVPPVSSFMLPADMPATQACYAAAPGPMTVLGRSNAVVIGQPAYMNIQWPAKAAPKCLNVMSVPARVSPAGYHAGALGLPMTALPHANLTVSLDDMLITSPCLRIEGADGDDRMTVVLGANWAKFTDLSKVELIGHGGNNVPLVHDYRNGGASGNSTVPGTVGPIDGSTVGGNHGTTPARMSGEAVYEEMSVGSVPIKVTFPASEGAGAKPLTTTYSVTETTTLTLDRYESVRLVGGQQGAVESLSPRTTIVLTKAEAATAAVSYDVDGRLVLTRNVTGGRTVVTRIPADFTALDFDFGGSTVDLTLASPPAFADAAAARSACSAVPRAEVTIRGVSPQSTVRVAVSMSRHLPSKAVAANSGYASYAAAVPSVRYSVIAPVAKVVAAVTLASDASAGALARAFVAAAVDIDASVVRYGAVHGVLIADGAAVEVEAHSLVVPTWAEGVDPLAVTSPIEAVQPPMRHPVIIRNAGRHTVTVQHVADSDVRTLPVAVTATAAHPLVDAFPVSYEAAIAAAAPAGHVKVSVKDSCTVDMSAALTAALGAATAVAKGRNAAAVSLTVTGPVHVVAHTIANEVELSQGKLIADSLVATWATTSFVRADIVAAAAPGASTEPTLNINGCPVGGVSVSAGSAIVAVDATQSAEKCRVPPVIHNTPDRRILVRGPAGYPVVYGFTAATPRALLPKDATVRCIASRRCPEESAKATDRCVYLTTVDEELREQFAAAGRQNTTDDEAAAVAAAAAKIEAAALWPRVRGWATAQSEVTFAYDVDQCVMPSVTCTKDVARSILFDGPNVCRASGVAAACRDQTRPGVIIADATTAQCSSTSAGAWSVVTASERTFAEIHALSSGKLSNDGGDLVGKAPLYLGLAIASIVVTAATMAITRLPFFFGLEAILVIGFAAAQDSASYGAQLGGIIRTLERVLTLTVASAGETGVTNGPSGIGAIVYTVVSVITLAAIVGVAIASIAASGAAAGRSTTAGRTAPATVGTVSAIGGTALYRAYAALRVLVYVLVAIAPWALWASARLAREGTAGSAAIGMFGVFATLAAFGITVVEFVLCDPATLKVLSILRRGVVIAHWFAIIVVLLVGSVIGGGTDSVTPLGWIGILYVIVQVAFAGYYFVQCFSKLGRNAPQNLSGGSAKRTANLQHKWVRTARWLIGVVSVSIISSVVGAVVSVLFFMAYNSGMSSGAEDYTTVLFWVWYGLGYVGLAVAIGYAVDSCGLPHAGGVPAVDPAWVDVVAPRRAAKRAAGSVESDEVDADDELSDTASPRGKHVAPMSSDDESAHDAADDHDEDDASPAPAVARAPTSPVRASAASSPNMSPTAVRAAQLQSFAPNGAAMIHPSFAPHALGMRGMADKSFMQSGVAAVYPMASSASEAFRSAALNSVVRSLPVVRSPPTSILVLPPLQLMERDE